MQLTTLGGNKAAMFMLIFANFKSCVLSRTPLGDCMMPRGDESRHLTEISNEDC